MLKKELNQVHEVQDKKSKRAEFFGGSFFTVPRKLEVFYQMKSVASCFIKDYFYAYFSTETGQKKQYKHFYNHELALEIKQPESSVRRGLKELEELGLFIILNFDKRGKIALINNEVNLKFAEEIASGERQVSFDTTIKSWLVSEKITNIFDKTHGEYTPPSNKNIERHGEYTPPMASKSSFVACNNLPKTIINSEVETSSKSSQESYIKESIYKETSSLDHLDSSSKKPNLEKVEAKKNDDEFYKNDLKEKKEFDFLEFENTRKEKPVVLKDLNELELEVQAFLTKDLGIEDQRLFFTYIRKLPNDLIMSKARYVAQKMAAKQVTNPESYLNKLLATELSKNETVGNVGIDGRVKRNDFKQIILFFSEIKNIDGNKNITRTNSIDSANNIEINKKNIAFELYRLYCFQNKAEIKAKLEYFMKEMPKFLHLQDFKDILETEKLLDQAKKDRLIEMFRGEK